MSEYGVEPPSQNWVACPSREGELMPWVMPWTAEGPAPPAPAHTLQESQPGCCSRFHAVVAPGMVLAADAGAAGAEPSETNTPYCPACTIFPWLSQDLITICRQPGSRASVVSRELV